MEAGVDWRQMSKTTSPSGALQGHRCGAAWCCGEDASDPLCCAPPCWHFARFTRVEVAHDPGALRHGVDEANPWESICEATLDSLASL